MTLSELERRKVAVLGAGVEGVAAWQLARELGCPACSVFSESETNDAPPGMDLTIGRLTFDTLSQYDVIIKSPGISLYREDIQRLIYSGMTVTSGTNLFFANRPAAKVIAITGTKGKSTVTSLAAHLIQATGRNVEIGGNHGRPLIELISSDADVIVAELSSYQTADFEGRADVALLTNLYPEHLDWHGNVEQYAHDKLRLFLDADHRLCRNAERQKFTQLEGAKDYLAEAPWTRNGTELFHDGTLVDHAFPLRGSANFDNLLAALNAVESVDVRCRDVLASLANFTPLAHRQQVVRQAGGIRFVDDSIATTPHATRAALDAFSDRPVGLIVGGFERGVEWQEFAHFLSKQPLAFVSATGQNGPRILAELASSAPGQPRAAAADLSEAVHQVRSHLGSSGTVLLSPGAPSYGQYRNYAQRGDAFASICRQLVEPEDVIDFWFGSPIARQDALWWRGGDSADREIRDRFGMTVQQALDGQLAYWQADNTGCVALIVVLDQFTRNMYRGTAKAFAGDPLARSVCQQLLAADEYRELHPLMRVFSYMPLEHSEDIADQERCIALFEELENDEPRWAEYVSDNTRYARDHRDIIHRFGRFPHRNKALGRSSTAAETEYLASGARRFGQ